MDFIIKVWALKSKLAKTNDFARQNTIALGWGYIGDLSRMTDERIKTALSRDPYFYSGYRLIKAYNSLKIFYGEMRAGDIAAVVDGDEIYFAQIESGYFFDGGDDLRYAHKRRISGFNVKCDKSDLSKGLSADIETSVAITDISKNLKEIRRILSQAYGGEAKRIKI